MSDQNPLNPTLYHALRRIFHHVEISNAGIPRQVLYVPDWHYGGRKSAVAIDSGEYYRISCPFCRESRQRLYINHEWGEIDPQTGRRNFHLAHCFNNDQCLAWETAQRALHHWVYPLGRSAEERLKRPTTSFQAAPLPPREFSLPDNCVPLHELPSAHPAAVYWQKRGFDLRELGGWWQVAYCDHCPTTSPPIYQRVVIPIYERRVSCLAGQATERFAGWQARIVDEPATAVPKYLSCRGMQKARLLYNLPLALQTSGPVFVCEGVADVWKVGPAGVALLGKSLSSQQKTLLATCFAQRPIVVLLDRDAKDEAQQILQVLRAARQHTPGDNRVVVAALPPGRKDPGDCTREEVFQAAQAALMPPSA